MEAIILPEHPEFELNVKEGIFPNSVEIERNQYIDLDTSKLASHFKLPKGVIISGGFVSYLVDKVYNNIRVKAVPKDIDIYIRASCPNKAIKIMSKLINNFRLSEYINSKYAISFKDVDTTCFVQGEMLDYNVMSELKVASSIKVQIIKDRIPKTDNILKDLMHIFKYYDLSCSKFATDGKTIYTTKDAMKSMFETRLCRVPRARVSPSLLSRIIKYGRRGYNFILEDIIVNPNSIGYMSVERAVAPEYIKSSGYEQETMEDLDKVFNEYRRTGVCPKLIMSRTTIGPTIEDLSIADSTYIREWSKSHRAKFCKGIVYVVPNSEIKKKLVMDYYTAKESFIKELKDIKIPIPFTSEFIITLSTPEEVENLWVKPDPYILSNTIRYEHTLLMSSLRKLALEMGDVYGTFNRTIIQMPQV